MEVHSKLGSGFLEKVYENSLMLLFRREGIAAKQQAPVKVCFEGEIVGEYRADILVDETIVLELKTADKVVDIHRAQMLHYLQATGIKLGMILNFGSKNFEYERLVL